MKRYLRIIPRLDVKGPNLVKGIHLEGLRVLGNPDYFAKNYYRRGACELFYMDVVASLYGRNSLKEMISATSRDIFIPITVGGGLRTLEDINSVLRAGADKVALNTAAVKNPDLVREAAEKFGSSTIVVCIEAIKQPDGRYLAFVDNGREHTGLDVVAWAEQVEKLGAGELVITSVDREGTGEGFDIDLISNISDRVRIPVVAHGGCSSIGEVLEVVKQTNVSGVSIASALHYWLVENMPDESLPAREEGNLSFLQQKRGFRKVGGFDLRELVRQLSEQNVVCRGI